MLTIGLTGGIGSGKTFASSIFQELNIEQVDADVVAREVVEPGQPALEKIKHKFADIEDLILANGELNRPRLREIIFSDKHAKNWLEKLLHPLIRAEIISRINGFKGKYGLLISPLLLETNQKQLVNRILVVDVPTEIQIKRVTERDNISEKLAQNILSNQISREQRLSEADDIIDNNISREYTRKRIEELHHCYLALADK